MEEAESETPKGCNTFDPETAPPPSAHPSENPKPNLGRGWSLAGCGPGVGRLGAPARWRRSTEIPGAGWGELEPWVQALALPFTGCLNLGSHSASVSFSFLSCEVEAIHTKASSLF